MHIVLAHQANVVARQNAAFGDDALAFGNVVEQFQGVFQRGFKRTQIAVVDAQQRCFQGKCGFKLAAIVYFHQHIHAQFHGRAFQIAQLVRRQGGNNQQDAVGPQCARVRHLVGVDHEIFAQHRQGTGRAGLTQVIVRALEKFHIGKHRQAGGTVRRIRGGDFNRVEIFANDPARGRRLFDFGDDGRLALGNFFFDRSGKAAQILAAFCLAQYFRFAAHLAGRSHFCLLRFENRGEHVVHEFSVRV